MLQVFFEREEKDGGGKVKEIYIDRRNRCAMIEFEEAKGTTNKTFYQMNKTRVYLY